MEDQANYSGGSGDSVGPSSAELASQLSAKSHDIFKLQEELIAKRQELSVLDMRVSECEGERTAAESAVKKAKEDADRSVQCMSCNEVLIIYEQKNMVHKL